MMNITSLVNNQYLHMLVDSFRTYDWTGTNEYDFYFTENLINETKKRRTVSDVQVKIYLPSNRFDVFIPSIVPHRQKEFDESLRLSVEFFFQKLKTE